MHLSWDSIKKNKKTAEKWAIIDKKWNGFHSSASQAFVFLSRGNFFSVFIYFEFQTNGNFQLTQKSWVIYCLSKITFCSSSNENIDFYEDEKRVKMEKRWNE